MNYHFFLSWIESNLIGFRRRRFSEGFPNWRGPCFQREWDTHVWHNFCCNPTKITFKNSVPVVSLMPDLKAGVLLRFFVCLFYSKLMCLNSLIRHRMLTGDFFFWEKAWISGSVHSNFICNPSNIHHPQGKFLGLGQSVSCKIQRFAGAWGLWALGDYPTVKYFYW